MSNNFRNIIQEWLSIQESSELEQAINFDDKVEREITAEATKPKIVQDGNRTIELEPTNIERQKRNLRKKYYER